LLSEEAKRRYLAREMVVTNMDDWDKVLKIIDIMPGLD
jgi:hypothetical protein